MRSGHTFKPPVVYAVSINMTAQDLDAVVACLWTPRACDQIVTRR
nr:hypothetical protein [Bradyrhizobium diazoefficiens]